MAKTCSWSHQINTFSMLKYNVCLLFFSLVIFFKFTNSLQYIVSIHLLNWKITRETKTKKHENKSTNNFWRNSWDLFLHFRLSNDHTIATLLYKRGGLHIYLPHSTFDYITWKHVNDAKRCSARATRTFLVMHTEEAT